MPDAATALLGGLGRASGEGPPLYLRLRRGIEEAIRDGAMQPGDALPSERELAQRAEVSRVTVRRAMQDLVRAGLLVQRRGSGTFVAAVRDRVEQPLSQLTSFTQDMARRGLSSHSVWLERGLFGAAPREMMALGLQSGEMVARLARLRLADGMPIAIERAAISASVLPDPMTIGRSLYETLAATGHRPVRAVQRISAAGIGMADARLLAVEAGSPGLSIERISYLASGRAVEFTRSIYRGDAYDFVAELKLAGDGAAPEDR